MQVRERPVARGLNVRIWATESIQGQSVRVAQQNHPVLLSSSPSVSPVSPPRTDLGCSKLGASFPSILHRQEHVPGEEQEPFLLCVTLLKNKDPLFQKLPEDALVHHWLNHQV